MTSVSSLRLVCSYLMKMPLRTSAESGGAASSAASFCESVSGIERFLRVRLRALVTIGHIQVVVTAQTAGREPPVSATLSLRSVRIQNASFRFRS